MLPGISGGTMAFVLGIYKKLIFEISKTGPKHFKSIRPYLLFKKKPKSPFFWNNYDWAFLSPLLLGLLLAVFLFVALAPELIERWALPFYSALVGLVLASLFKPFREMKKTRRTLTLFCMFFLLSGGVFVFGENLFSFPAKNPSPFLFFPAGFVVAGTLIIPGLSGSYILLILGLYEKTLLALKAGDLPIIFCFFVGALLGIFFMARWMNYFLKNHFDETMAFVSALLLTSLYAIYPLSKTEPKTDFFVLSEEKLIFIFYATSAFFGFLALNYFSEKKKS